MNVLLLEISYASLNVGLLAYGKESSHLLHMSEFYSFYKYHEKYYLYTHFHIDLVGYLDSLHLSIVGCFSYSLSALQLL